MKHVSALIAISLLLLFTAPVLAQDHKFVEDFLERFETSQQYIRKVATMMPEEHYNYKATPESMSFAEHLLHIGWAMDWHSQSLLGGREARDWKTDTIYKTANKSKDEMIATLHKTFSTTADFLKNFDQSQMDDELEYFGAMRSKRQIFLLLADHITHHRAQMLVLMRLQGITPPRYVLYQ